MQCNGMSRAECDRVSQWLMEAGICDTHPKSLHCNVHFCDTHRKPVPRTAWHYDMIPIWQLSARQCTIFDSIHCTAVSVIPRATHFLTLQCTTISAIPTHPKYPLSILPLLHTPFTWSTSLIFWPSELHHSLFNLYPRHCFYLCLVQIANWALHHISIFTP